MRVLLLSRYERIGASSRVRSYQYLPQLSKYGIEVVNRPFFPESYLKRLYAGRRANPIPILNAVVERLLQLFKSKSFDLLWVEKEILPWLPPFMEVICKNAGKPLIVDYDDAIFHRYDRHKSGVVRKLLGRKIDTIVRNADLVVGGNRYLCQHFKQVGAKRVEFLPSVIDLNRYPSPFNPSCADHFTIGWIGSPTTSMYLKKIVPILKSFTQNNRSRILLIGNRNFSVDGLPVEMRDWQEAREVQDIDAFDVGLMPLDDSPWAKGKCGYKLIQYMACGKAVIAARTKANADIVQDGVSGFLVDTAKEWYEALQILYVNRDLREKMGQCGRKIVEGKFCIQKTAPQLASWFFELHKGNQRQSNQS